MSDTLQKAIATIKAGNKSAGKQLLTDILKTDADNEQAWLWMTKVVDSNSERVNCLQQALRINPNNETAQYVLASLQGQDNSASIPPVESTDPAPIKPIKKTSPPNQSENRSSACQRENTSAPTPPETQPLIIRLSMCLPPQINLRQ